MASSSRWLSGLLASIVLLWSWYGHFWPHLHTANEAIRLYFVQALVDDGRPELDAVTARHRSVPVDRSERNGHIYMDKAPGTSLLALPVYPLVRAANPAAAGRDLWQVGWLSTIWAVALPLAGALWLLGQLLLAWGIRAREVALVLLALATASPLWVYATLLFGHGLAAAAVAAAVLGVGAVAHPSRQRLLACGLAAGFAGLVDTPLFVFAAAASVWLVWRQVPAVKEVSTQHETTRVRLLGGVRGALPWLAGLGVCVLAQLAYNTWVLGHPLRFTYQFKADRALAQIMDTGFLGFRPPQLDALVGLLFGARRGLFFHAPWLLAAVVGLVLAARDRNRPAWQRRDARALLALAGGYTLFVSGFADWPAGDSACARHLLPVLPLLAPGLAFVVVEPRLAPLGRAAVGAAVLLGVLLHLPTVASFPYHFAQLPQPVLELSWPLVLQGHFAPSIGRLLGWPEGLSFAAFLVLLAAPWLARTRLPSTWPVRRLELAIGLGLTLLGLAAAMSALPPRSRQVEVALYRAQTFLRPASDGADARPP
jgi:hypothetical protein